MIGVDADVVSQYSKKNAHAAARTKRSACQVCVGVMFGDSHPEKGGCGCSKQGAYIYMYIPTYTFIYIYICICVNIYICHIYKLIYIYM